MNGGWSDPREQQDQYGDYYKPRGGVTGRCPCGYSKSECLELVEKRKAGGWCLYPDFGSEGSK